MPWLLALTTIQFCLYLYFSSSKLFSPMSLSEQVNQWKYQNRPISNGIFLRYGVSFTQNNYEWYSICILHVLLYIKFKDETRKNNGKMNMCCVVACLLTHREYIRIVSVTLYMRHICVSVVADMPTYSLSINLNEHRMCHSRIVSPFISSHVCAPLIICIYKS